ncbi:MAG: hypothetical protein ACOC9H_02815 [Gemmatimonadota bacterium]
MKEAIAWGVLVLFVGFMVREALRKSPCQECGKETRGTHCKRHRRGLL